MLATASYTSTLNSPIHSDPTQSTQDPNQSQRDQELCHEGQHQIQSEQDDPSLPGNLPVMNAVLTSCNSILEDFRSSWISKATALSRIYTHLLDGIPENDISFASTIEEAFSHYLTVVENHQHHLKEAQYHDHQQCLETPPDDCAERGNPDNDQRHHKCEKAGDTQCPWIISDFIPSGKWFFPVIWSYLCSLWHFVGPIGLYRYMQTFVGYDR